MYIEKYSIWQDIKLIFQTLTVFFKADDSTEAFLSLIHIYTTFVSIDGFVRGTGTASCGQDTLMKYRFVLDDTIEFRFAMKPITR